MSNLKGVYSNTDVYVLVRLVLEQMVCPLVYLPLMLSGYYCVYVSTGFNFAQQTRSRVISKVRIGSVPCFLCSRAVCIGIFSSK